MPSYYEPTYGDNIYEIGALCGMVLREAGWSEDKIKEVHAEARRTTYDNAIAVYSCYISIKRK